MLTHLDLFSGIGGFALACQWAGIETIGFVEIDKYCQKVLRKHWPAVPIVEDIRDVETIKEVVANALYQRWARDREAWERRFGFKDINQIFSNNCALWGKHTDCPGCQCPCHDSDILVTAGFPCQPFSVAGKRGSTEDDRYLWPETLAVIKAIKPKWVLLENVTGIINLALGTVLSDLEGAGYGHETLIIPACAVNAWHRRDRVWIVANTRSLESRRLSNIKWPANTETRGSRQVVAVTASRQSWEQAEPEGRQDSGRGSQEVTVADTKGRRLAKRIAETAIQHDVECRDLPTGEYTETWWDTEPKLGRVAHGIPPELDGYWDCEPAIPRVATGVKNRVDRLKCLGNAIVPAVAAQIIQAIKEIDAQCRGTLGDSPGNGIKLTN